MKKVRILAAILMVVMVGFAFSACLDTQDEATQLYEYKEKGSTKDVVPLSYVRVLVVLSSSETSITFNASDFSIVRNGVKENGLAFITGFHSETVNEQETYTSIIESTQVIEKNAGANLDIVFTGKDNITELYYKSDRIRIK